MKRKSMKLPGKSPVAQNPSVHFEEHCTKIDHVSLILYASFSLKPNS